ncbi:XdhC family protein [Rhizobium mesosinicum]|uniref:XdhC family protein n=1 Tax=Rhizobium mesosinicum TaxID=335017 RepID=A0ABS7GM76_9HYPH|nr:XdhC family protein [Rhizobium mesosinicum]MBW9051083.1 XdhC family protein [Rhizobium mesosinicum]
MITQSNEEVIRFATQGHESGTTSALVALVEIRGGAPRPLGSLLAVRETGLYCGYISGGCVEAAVATEAIAAIHAGQDRMLKFGEGSPFFDIVLPCGGGITVAIHIVRDAKPLRTVLAELNARRCASLDYDARLQSLTAVSDIQSVGWTGDVFRVRFRPKCRVVAAGRSIEADVTARVLQSSGYEVISTGLRDELDLNCIDPDTAFITLSHDLENEVPLLARVLSSTIPFYLGALGGKRTHARRSEMLRSLGCSDMDINRIVAPIGLLPQARDASTLAISVAADIAASRHALVHI